MTTNPTTLNTLALDAIGTFCDYLTINSILSFRLTSKRCFQGSSKSYLRHIIQLRQYLNETLDRHHKDSSIIKNNLGTKTMNDLHDLNEAIQLELAPKPKGAIKRYLSWYRGEVKEPFEGKGLYCEFQMDTGDDKDEVYGLVNYDETPLFLVFDKYNANFDPGLSASLRSKMTAACDYQHLNDSEFCIQILKDVGINGINDIINYMVHDFLDAVYWYNGHIVHCTVEAHHYDAFTLNVSFDNVPLVGESIQTQDSGTTIKQRSDVPAEVWNTLKDITPKESPSCVDSIMFLASLAVLSCPTVTCIGMESGRNKLLQQYPMLEPFHFRICQYTA